MKLIISLINKQLAACQDATNVEFQISKHIRIIETDLNPTPFS